MGAKLRTWGAWHEEGDRKGSEGTSPSVRNNGILTWLVGCWQTVVETGSSASSAPLRCPSPPKPTPKFAPMGASPPRRLGSSEIAPTERKLV